MEFTAPKISMCHKSLETGSVNIDESKENINTVYEEIVEANEALLVELSGDVKKKFASAKETTEGRLKNVTYTLGNMAELIQAYSDDNKKINENADLRAGFNSWMSLPEPFVGGTKDE